MKIAIVGEFPDRSQRARLSKLAELVSRKILRESKKSEFQNKIFLEMRALNT
jgi:hypothetical protein